MGLFSNYNGPAIFELDNSRFFIQHFIPKKEIKG